MNQPLNAVLELDEDAERRHAADDTLVGLAHELRHVLDLFHIGRLALRLDGDALTRRGVLRRLGEERTQTLAFLRRDMPRGKRLAQETMHEEVGVASDRRGKMRIVARRKAKVPKARRRIARLLHRTQGDGPDDALLGLSLDAIEHLLDVGGAHLAVLIDMEAQTERCEEALQTLDLLRGGRLMHAVDERLFLQLHVARHGLICREHALFDDGLADRARTLFERDGMSIGIELYLDLGQLKVNRAAPMTLGAQHLAQTAQRLKHRADVAVVRDERLITGKDAVDKRIGKAARNMDHARHDLIASDLAVHADLHLTRHRETIHALVQAADPVRQLLREHRNHTVDEIDARPAPRRLTIERFARTDIVADIGDIDAEEEPAVLLIGVDTVVDVLRILTINRDNGEITSVTPPCILLGKRILRAARRRLCDIGRELLIEIVGAHDGEHVHAGVARLAEHLDDASLGAPALLRPLRDLDDDLAARLCPAKVLFQHKDIAPDLRAVGRDKAERLAALERADDMRIDTLKDADDLPLARASWLLGRRDACDHAVTVHRRPHRTAGDKDIRLLLRLTHIGDDEAESFRRHGEPPHHEIHTARQAIKAAAVADDRTLGLKRGKSIGELLPFALREPQPRTQLRLRQRAIGVLPHKGVDPLLERIQLFLFHIFLFFRFYDLLPCTAFSKKSAVRSNTRSLTPSSSGSRWPASGRITVSQSVLATCARSSSALFGSAVWSRAPWTIRSGARTLPSLLRAAAITSIISWTETSGMRR